MEDIKMLEILKRIELFLKRDSVDLAMDYVRLEIDNLKGITQQRCQNARYYYDWYCNHCSNENCGSNKNKLYRY